MKGADPTRKRARKPQQLPLSVTKASQTQTSTSPAAPSRQRRCKGQKPSPNPTPVLQNSVVRQAPTSQSPKLSTTFLGSIRNHLEKQHIEDFPIEAVNALATKLMDPQAMNLSAADRASILVLIHRNAGMGFHEALSKNESIIALLYSWGKKGIKEEDGETLMPLLKIMKKFPMGADILKSSKYGRLVKQLSKITKSQTIQELCETILDAWRIELGTAPQADIAEQVVTPRVSNKRKGIDEPSSPRPSKKITRLSEEKIAVSNPPQSESKSNKFNGMKARKTISKPSALGMKLPLAPAFSSVALTKKGCGTLFNLPLEQPIVTRIVASTLRPKRIAASSSSSNSNVSRRSKTKSDANNSTPTIPLILSTLTMPPLESFPANNSDLQWKLICRLFQPKAISKNPDKSASDFVKHTSPLTYVGEYSYEDKNRIVKLVLESGSTEFYEALVKNLSGQRLWIEWIGHELRHTVREDTTRFLHSLLEVIEKMLDITGVLDLQLAHQIDFMLGAKLKHLEGLRIHAAKIYKKWMDIIRSDKFDAIDKIMASQLPILQLPITSDTLGLEDGEIDESESTDDLEAFENRGARNLISRELALSSINFKKVKRPSTSPSDPITRSSSPYTSSPTPAPRMTRRDSAPTSTLTHTSHLNTGFQPPLRREATTGSFDDRGRAPPSYFTHQQTSSKQQTPQPPIYTQRTIYSEPLEPKLYQNLQTSSYTPRITYTPATNTSQSKPYAISKAVLEVVQSPYMKRFTPKHLSQGQSPGSFTPPLPPHPFLPPKPLNFTGRSAGYQSSPLSGGVMLGVSARHPSQLHDDSPYHYWEIIKNWSC